MLLYNSNDFTYVYSGIVSYNFPYATTILWFSEDPALLCLALPFNRPFSLPWMPFPPLLRILFTCEGTPWLLPGQVYDSFLPCILCIPITALISLCFTYKFTGLQSWRVGTVSSSTLYAPNFITRAGLNGGSWPVNGWMIYWTFKKKILCFENTFRKKMHYWDTK